MDNSQKELLDIWKKGKPLDEAAWHFTDYKIWQKYENLNVKENRDNQIMPKGMADILGNFAKQLNEINQYSKQKQAAQNELWDNLFNKIIRGSLIAIGFKLPDPANFPDFIPLHMWPPENTDIDKSSISANNIEYSRVRIIKKSALNKKAAPIQKLPPNISVKDKKIGRPSLKIEIIAAYEYLKKHGRIDYSKFLKSHTEIVHETVMQLFPEITSVLGMEHEAIRRAVGDRFKADRVASDKRRLPYEYVIPFHATGYRCWPSNVQ